MTNRLPIPGQDDGTWGQILNSYLLQSLNNDGTIQASALSSAGALLASNNLSDISNAASALLALGGVSQSTTTNSTSIVWQAGLTGDSYFRSIFNSDGTLNIGPGSVAPYSGSHIAGNVGSGSDTDFYLRGINDRAAILTIQAPLNGTYGDSSSKQLQIWRDKNGSPITWIGTYGAGLMATDNIGFLSGTLTRQIAMMFRISASRTLPSLVFGTDAVQTADTGDTNTGTWIALTNTHELTSSAAFKSWALITADINGTIVGIGNNGPAGQGGISVGTLVKLYKDLISSVNYWHSNSGILIDGIARIQSQSTSGKPDVADQTLTNMGLRWDSTLGLVYVVGGTDRWRIGVSGNFVPASTNTYDIGATTARVGNIYLQQGLIWSSVSVQQGTGTPEGAVTANIGSIFLRSDGGTGTSVYVKESGASNTGWKALVSLGTTLDQLAAPVANISMNSHNINSLANASVDTDAVAFNQINRQLSTSYTPATTSNSTTETTIISPTITGAQAGDLYRLHARGSIVNNSGSAVTYQVKVKLGSTLIIMTDAVSIGTSALTKQWTMDIDLMITSDTSHEDARLVWMITNGSANNAPNMPSASAGGAAGGGSGLSDMTTNPTLTVTMTMGTANSNASFTFSSFYMERLR